MPGWTEQVEIQYDKIELEKINSRIIEKSPKLVCHKTNFVSEMIFEDEKEIFLFVSSSLQTIFGCDS